MDCGNGHVNIRNKMYIHYGIGKRDRSKMGFKAPMYISKEMIEFMHLDQLECGGLVSMAFCTKFITQYMKLGELFDPHFRTRIVFNNPLLDLFKNAMEIEKISEDGITYFDIQKLLKHHWSSVRTVLPEKRRYCDNVIARPGNVDTLEDFLDDMRDKLNDTKKLKKDPTYIETLKVMWIAMGLPGWKEVTVVENGVKIIKIKVYIGDDDPECIICMETLKSVVFMPCKHVCSCNNCAKAIMKANGLCPICRAVISGSIKYDKDKHD